MPKTRIIIHTIFTIAAIVWVAGAIVIVGWHFFHGPVR
jgi:hypothetical protein